MPTNTLFAFVPGSNVLYDGNDGGVFKFVPAADAAAIPAGQWTSMNGGATSSLNSIQVRGVAVNQTAPPTLIEGSQDNGFAQKIGITAQGAGDTTWNGIHGLWGDGYGAGSVLHQARAIGVTPYSGVLERAFTGPLPVGLTPTC